MLRPGLIIAAGVLAAAATAQAATLQPLPDLPKDLARTPFTPPTSLDAPAERGVRQSLGASGASRWSVYAGASGNPRELRDGPRWRSGGEARSPNQLVNTRVGVEWEKGDARASLGYLRRRLPGPPSVFGDKIRRDSMLGVSVAFRKF